jgi:hypothetical protein
VGRGQALIPYLIWAPSYRRNSGGISVLHQLCHNINQTKGAAWITTPHTNPALKTPYADPRKQRELVSAGAIAIYPEIVTGNPLRAKRVVRWVLYKPGVLGGQPTYDPHETVYAYNQMLFQDGYKDILSLPMTETALFRPPERPQNRSGALVYVGKGKRPSHLPAGTEITREWPSSREVLARLFQHAEVFYCYDPLTALTDEARLCGCPVVLSGDGAFDRTRYEQSELGTNGLAFEPSELARAKTTVAKVPTAYKQWVLLADRQFSRFLADTQHLPEAPVRAVSDLRVLALPVDDGGCGNYRVRQPMRMLNGHAGTETHLVDTKADASIAVAQALAVSDVCVVRQGGEGGMRKIKAMPEYTHLKWVLDIDDQNELTSPYHDSYQTYGTEEFFDPKEGLRWKDGEKGFDLAANRQRIASLIQGMREADLVTVTTPALADYARQYNKNVAVLPNCIDTSIWWPPARKPAEKLRVGWSGGSSHYEDLYSIKKQLNSLLRTHDFTLVLIGSGKEWGIFDEDVQDKIEYWPWVPFPAHSWRMMAMNLDIAIIPLVDEQFERYKSCVKWYEFSALGLPSVVAARTPYKEEVEDGKTGLLYTTPHDFKTQLETLIDNPSLRETIGKQARAWVLANRDAKQNAKLWHEAYLALL